MNRQEMLVGMLKVVEGRSKCSRAQVGCIIAREGRVLSVGYNGGISGGEDCLCMLNDQGQSAGIGCLHAEANAIAWAAKEGIQVDGAEMYCSLSPCVSCAKLILNAGISKLYYVNDYRCLDGLKLLKKHAFKLDWN